MKQLCTRMTMALILALFTGTAKVKAAWTHDIGAVSLFAELGASKPTGTNITVSQIEGSYLGNYYPDIYTNEFSGKTFVDKTAMATGSSLHATMVGKYFYGRSSSISPNINHVDCYWEEDWRDAGFLSGGDGGGPAVETNRIQNHSWIGNSGSDSNYVRRLDYAIDRDGFTCVAGLNNTNDAIPGLLGHTYNGIVVGRTDGSHSAGPTLFDEAGRVKPDIVAPFTFTSYATPAVGSCAALLMETADKHALTSATMPQTIKALLLAGATKTEFGTNWNRTASRPLDEHYGAGEINIYNSWHILTNGEQNASATSLVNHIGWDYSELPAAGTNWYFFDSPDSHAPSRFSVVLTWHRKISDPPGGGFNPQAFLANLNLYLYEADGFATNDLVDMSTSQVDNVEHIFQGALPPGRYALKVTSDAEAEYGLAWHKAPAAIPEFTETSYHSNTGFVIKVSTSPNVFYGIQATTNLMDGSSWTNLATQIPSTSLWTFVDAKATNLIYRYYKAFVAPD